MSEEIKVTATRLDIGLLVDARLSYALRSGDYVSADIADDLLAALQLLVLDVQNYEAWQRPCHALDVARAAIAKAHA